ncbi:MAG TPA: cupredoxin domain-containing protein [Dehalococcoidia bacterium]|nr:cupredoxin domain-containing protein [Dehalococcoidia bacterium]
MALVHLDLAPKAGRWDNEQRHIGWLEEESMNEKRWLTLVIVALSLSAALLVACGDDDDDDDGEDGADDVGRVEHTTGMTAWQGEEVVIRASDFAFDPPELRVGQQERYMLHLVNDSGQLHDWSIDAMPATEVRVLESAEHEMDEDHASPMPDDMGTAMPGESMARLHVAAEAGMDRHISFVPMEKGEYTFYCTVGNHREAGMEGKLFVE